MTTSGWGVGNVSAGCIQPFSPSSALSVKPAIVRINELGGLYPIETWRDLRGRRYYRVNLGGIPFREQDPDRLASLILCCSVDTTLNRFLRMVLGVFLLLAFLWTSSGSDDLGSWIIMVIMAVLMLEGLVVVKSILDRRRSLECLLYWGRRLGSSPIIFHPYREVLRVILENAKSCSFPRCKIIVSTILGKYEITYRGVLRSMIKAQPIREYAS